MIDNVFFNNILEDDQIGCAILQLIKLVAEMCDQNEKYKVLLYGITETHEIDDTVLFYAVIGLIIGHVFTHHIVHDNTQGFMKPELENDTSSTMYELLYHDDIIKLGEQQTKEFYEKIKGPHKPNLKPSNDN